jgi:hypothetical protein
MNPFPPIFSTIFAALKFELARRCRVVESSCHACGWWGGRRAGLLFASWHLYFKGNSVDNCIWVDLIYGGFELRFHRFDI